MVWYDNNWNRRRSIVLDQTTPSANCQIKVVLSSTILTWAQLTSGNANGNDIRFTGSDGITLQDHWIESWNSIGTIVDAIIWVNVTVSGTSSIYMYYGNSGAMNTSNMAIIPTGGTITEISDYRIHKFIDNGTFISDRNINVRVLVVGGGGSGDGGNEISTGGGDGGQVIHNPSFFVNGSTSVTIGAGGVWTSGGNGQNSIFSTIIATGGSVGRPYEQGGYGACGTSFNYLPGPGCVNDISGTAITYARGGYSGGRYGLWGNGQIPAPNTGDGGGGKQGPTIPGSGGSGIVIVRYPVLTDTLGIEEPNITATYITLDHSDPCLVGICTVTVNATWTNNGTVSGDFIPNIKIDNNIQPPIYLSQTLTAGANVVKSFSITGLSIGTHTICPDPN